MAPSAPARPPRSAAPAGPRRFDARQIMGPAKEVLIRHNGEDYRLRLTANGKLILTK